MTRLSALTIPLVVSGLLLLSASAVAAELPTCTADELELPVVYGEEVATHRQFDAPVVTYPADRFPDAIKLVQQMALRVDETGTPTCISAWPAFAAVPTPEVVALKLEVASWRYAPFERDGRAVAVHVAQDIASQKLPTRRVPVPAIAAETLSVTLVRAGCFYGCPQYAVNVRGDGRIGYFGIDRVDVDGRHAWRLPAADAAHLVALARDPVVWAAADTYRAQARHQETTMLRIAVGSQRKQILAYGGELAGMPVAIRRLQEAVDKLADAQRLTMLSHAGIDQLQSEGFDFRSPAAGTILYRAITHRRPSLVPCCSDESAILRLLELGAPIDVLPPGSSGSAIEAVLRIPYPALIEPLITRGALETEGRPDQAKIDAAFVAAITGGRLAEVQRIWNVAGGNPRPSLEVEDPTNRDLEVVKRVPAVLLLDAPYGGRDGWEGFAIARWFAERGVELNARRKDGRTLLHAAAYADDAAFFNWLLERGVDPRPLGDTRLLEISVEFGEDTALGLLEAQARQTRAFQLAPDYGQAAEMQKWTRVLAWLDAHPEVASRVRPSRCPDSAAHAAADSAADAAADPLPPAPAPRPCNR
jgi:hypothetical protein